MSKQGTLISKADDQEGANPTIITPNNPFPIQLYNALGNPVDIDNNNHIGIVNHAHDEGGHVHFKASLSASQDFILIDLSDTDGYPHDNTLWVHTSNMVLGIDSSSDADYILKIGILENVDDTNGDFHGVFDISGTRKTGVDHDVSITQAPEAPQMRSSNFLSPKMLNQTAFNTGTNLASTKDVLTADTPSGNGDVVVRATINAGTVNVSILMGYHSHN